MDLPKPHILSVLQLLAMQLIGSKPWGPFQANIATTFPISGSWQTHTSCRVSSRPNAHLSGVWTLLHIQPQLQVSCHKSYLQQIYDNMSTRTGNQWHHIIAAHSTAACSHRKGYSDDPVKGLAPIIAFLQYLVNALLQQEKNCFKQNLARAAVGTVCKLERCDLTAQAHH